MKIFWHNTFFSYETKLCFKVLLLKTY